MDGAFRRLHGTLQDDHQCVWVREKTTEVVGGFSRWLIVLLAGVFNLLACVFDGITRLLSSG
jgi:hypothetical protein